MRLDRLPADELLATVSPDAGPAPAIQVEEVTKVFPGPQPITALAGVSFTVPEGGFVSLLGPSGCGKSTLLRMAAGLEPVTRGRIRVRDASCEEMRRRCAFGVVFQSPALFDWRTVEANVALPLEIMRVPRAEVRARTAELLELVGLADFRRHHPWQLSGGMQQRVAIARALTFRPPFLLMDEPFGALDMMTRERMQTELLSIWSSRPGTTVLFVTHSVAEAVLLSDRVVLLSARPGRVLRVLEVDLPRPRTEEVRESDRFREIERELRRLVRAEQGG
jgi:NitT/TauT family transport system ATP-binding protein